MDSSTPGLREAHGAVSLVSTFARRSLFAVACSGAIACSATDGAQPSDALDADNVAGSGSGSVAGTGTSGAAVGTAGTSGAGGSTDTTAGGSVNRAGSGGTANNGGSGDVGGAANTGGNAGNAATGGTSPSGGTAGAGGSPPSSCSNAQNPIPDNLMIHTLADSVVQRQDFGKYSHWYEEQGHQQLMRLWDGDQNQRRGITHLNPRIEAFADHFQATSADDWHFFSADFTFVKLGPQVRAIIQEKSGDEAVQWEVHIRVYQNKLWLQHRRNPKELIDDNILGKTVNLRVESNGRRYKVYYNCKLITDTVNQMDPSGKSSYAWRWGMYVINDEGSANLKEVGDSEIHVTGAKFR